jgi:hypothetical protein
MQLIFIMSLEPPPTGAKTKKFHLPMNFPHPQPLSHLPSPSTPIWGERILRDSVISPVTRTQSLVWRHEFFIDLFLKTTLITLPSARERERKIDEVKFMKISLKVTSDYLKIINSLLTALFTTLKRFDLASLLSLGS